jgi:H-NS histone C-terminal domain
MEWEYRKIDLNQHRPQKDEIDMLNAAGGDGWELLGITSNKIAYLKRALAPAPRVSTECTMPSAQGANGDCNDARRGGRAQEVRVKYRDPVTNETWSGRGRMATWLKRKQDAGEDIGKYLV